VREQESELESAQEVTLERALVDMREQGSEAVGVPVQVHE